MLNLRIFSQSFCYFIYIIHVVLINGIFFFFSDATMIGHVESWTTGEEFAKHLLNLRLAGNAS